MLYFATGHEQWPGYSIEWVHEEIGRIISIFRESSRLEEAGPHAPPSQLAQEPPVSIPTPRGRQEGHGIEHRRKAIDPLPEPIPAPRPRTAGWFRPPFVGTTYGSQPLYYESTHGHTGHQGWSTQTAASPPPPSQTQPVYYATAMAMASAEAGSSSHVHPEAWSQEDMDTLLHSLDYSADALGDWPSQQTAEATPPPYHPPASSPAEAPPAPPPQADPEQAEGRRRLPDRQARHYQWPPPS